jgi:hypothetical protein
MAAQKVVEASSAVEETRLPIERTCKRRKASVATQKASGTPPAVATDAGPPAKKIYEKGKPLWPP